MADTPIQSASTKPQAKAASGRKPAKPKSDKTGATKDASRLKIQVDFPGGARLGPGKIALLEHIEAEGSLSRAAESMGISYRRAWLFMSQINKAFDEPAVATPEHGHGGGPAKLTAFGRELIRHFRAIEAETTKANREILKWLERHRTSGNGSSSAANDD